MASSSASGVEGHELQESLAGLNNVLFLSAGDHHDAAVCISLLPEGSAEGTRFLAVTLDGGPDDKLDDWRAAAGSPPAESAIISVGEATRSAVAVQPAGRAETAPVTVDIVADPSDLTGIAMAIGSYLEAWGGSNLTPVVCFDSITSLLYHADESRVFRFLHSTTGRLRDLGAVAHYHLDPVAFDEATVNRFSALCEAVVRVDDDGSVDLQTRL